MENNSKKKKNIIVKGVKSFNIIIKVIILKENRNINYSFITLRLN